MALKQVAIGKSRICASVADRQLNRVPDLHAGRATILQLCNSLPSKARDRTCAPNSPDSSRETGLQRGCFCLLCATPALDCAKALPAGLGEPWASGAAGRGRYFAGRRVALDRATGSESGAIQTVRPGKLLIPPAIKGIATKKRETVKYEGQGRDSTRLMVAQHDRADCLPLQPLCSAESHE